MRVRSLQTFITDQGLVNVSPLSDLRGLKVGVDAVYWLRTLPNLKDPLADAIGGLPLSAVTVLDSIIQVLKKWELNFLFVFQGLQTRSHMLLTSQVHLQMDEAWQVLVRGHYGEAQHRFAQATSRITSDFVFVVSRFLQSRGCEVLQAPYSSGSQLAYLVQEGAVDLVFGPPAWMLLGIERLILNIDLKSGTFDWIDRQQLLDAWGINEAQLLDACLLAGTEHCLTFPYLNLPQMASKQLGGGPTGPSDQVTTRTTTSPTFLFAAAIQFVKRAPLIGYMQHFPTDMMRQEHTDSYCICRTLLKYPLALHFDGTVKPVHRKRPPATCSTKNDSDNVITSNMTIGPHASSYIAAPAPGSSQIEVPRDFNQIFGRKLPAALYCLMARNLLCRKLPAVLALGEWADMSHPTVDTQEYRDLLSEVTPYRLRAVGLIASRLHYEFARRPIRFTRYICHPPGNTGSGGCPQRVAVDSGLPNVSPSMRWRFTLEELLAEKERQGVDRIGIRFCLAWHSHELRVHNRFLCTPGSEGDPPYHCTHLAEVIAITNFRLLEALGYFTSDGSGTVFGSAVEAATPEFEEDLLFALELMKCGNLMGEPLEELSERPFPRGAQLLRHPEINQQYQPEILLLSRVVSLVAMQLTRGALWHAAIDFDLAAYHSCVKLLKKTLRHLAEACLVSELLPNVSTASIIPTSALAPFNGGLPTFLPPRNCLGIVMKYFLEWPAEEKARRLSTTATRQDRLATFTQDVTRAFVPCDDAVTDLCKGVRFWCALRKVMSVLAENTDVGNFQKDMEQAHNFLVRRIAEIGLDLHPAFQRAPDLAEVRQAVEAYVAANPGVPLESGTQQQPPPQPQQNVEEETALPPAVAAAS